MRLIVKIARWFEFRNPPRILGQRWQSDPVLGRSRLLAALGLALLLPNTGYTQSVEIPETSVCTQMPSSRPCSAREEGRPVPPASAGIFVGGAAMRPFAMPDFSVGGVAVQARAQVGLPAFHMDAVGSFTQPANEAAPEWQFRVHGSILYAAQLQDLTIRRGGPNGDLTRFMTGLGTNVDLGQILRVFFSVGVMGYGRERPAGSPPETAPFPRRSYVGGYIGGALTLHLWKFRNTLRGAVWLAFSDRGPLNEALARIGRGDELTFSRYLVQVPGRLGTGAMIENTLRLDAVQIGRLMTLSPEFQFLYSNMPDGTEMQITAGLSGNFEVE